MMVKDRILGLDLGTKTGWALQTEDGIEHGMIDFGKFSDVEGCRHHEFRNWLGSFIATREPSFIWKESGFFSPDRGQGNAMLFGFHNLAAEVNYYYRLPTIKEVHGSTLKKFIGVPHKLEGVDKKHQSKEKKKIAIQKVKKIQKNQQYISEYSAVINGEELAFKTEEKQRLEVASLVQSSLDLAKRYGYLKRQLSVTNATVKVNIGSMEQSISEWITFKNQSNHFIVNTYNALNTTNAQKRLNTTKIDVLEGVKVTRLYDEESRNKSVSEIDDICGQIDGKLEVVNAATDLIE